MRALIFIREKPEEAADIARKKLPLGNLTRPKLIEGVPGLPSPQGLKNVIEFDVKTPLKIKEDIAPDKFLNLRLVAEVKEELEAKR